MHGQWPKGRWYEGFNAQKQGWDEKDSSYITREDSFDEAVYKVVDEIAEHSYPKLYNYEKDALRDRLRHNQSIEVNGVTYSVNRNDTRKFYDI